jgi:glycosyltransferase involved in cell wall biosynthesis
LRLAVYHNQPSGGARRALYEVGSRLSQNHEIDVYTLTTSDQTLLDDRTWAARVRTTTFWLRTPIRMGLYLNELREWQDLRDMDQICATIAREIDAASYDAVLVDACRMTQAPSVLVHLHTPAAYYCHEPPRRFTDSVCRPKAARKGLYERLHLAWHRPARSILDNAVQKLDKRNVQAADILLTNSDFSRRAIHSYYGRDAAICRLGVDTDKFSPSDHEGDYIFSVGALEPHKGFDFLIRSVARIPREVRPPLVLVGNTDDAGLAAQLRRQGTALDVELTIRVGVSDEDLAGLYRNARIFAYAPHNEPFGLAVLEAMASSLPVVGVSEGGPLESIEDGVTGLLAPRDESAFAGAIVTLLGDRASRVEMGLAGRQRAVGSWSWEAAAARVEDQLLALAATKIAVPA